MDIHSDQILEDHSFAFVTHLHLHYLHFIVYESIHILIYVSTHHKRHGQQVSHVSDYVTLKRWFSRRPFLLCHTCAVAVDGTSKRGNVFA